MQKKKALMSIVSLALVGAVAVGGTLAYLSSNSNKLTNTFTVGTGYQGQGLYLDETDKSGTQNPTEISSTSRTEEGVAYTDLIPGNTVVKDPTFHLTAGSVNSYVFAQVTGIDELITKGFIVSDTAITDAVDPTDPDFAAESNLGEKWTKVDGTDGFDGLYVYTEQVDASTSTADVALDPLFQHVKFSSFCGNEYIKDDSDTAVDLNDIVIKGVAVQVADSTDSAAAQAVAEAKLAD